MSYDPGFGHPLDRLLRQQIAAEEAVTRAERAHADALAEYRSAHHRVCALRDAAGQHTGEYRELDTERDRLALVDLALLLKREQRAAAELEQAVEARQVIDAVVADLGL